MSEHTPLTEAEKAEKRLREHLYKTTGGMGIPDLDLVLDAARTSTATADTAEQCFPPVSPEGHRCTRPNGHDGPHMCTDGQEWTEDAATADTGLRERCRNLVSDWQANSGSRALGDPTAHTWNEAALQLLTALDATAAPTTDTEGGAL